MNRRLLFVWLGLLCCGPALWARPFIVLAYNVENLDDADGVALFDDYQPSQYTPRHVLSKVRNIAEVIHRFENGRGPDIILFQEIETDLTPSKIPPDYDAILQRYAGTTIERMLGPDFNPEIADLPAEALLAKAMADRGMTGYHVVAATNTVAPGSKRPLSQKCVIFTRFPVRQVLAHPTEDARAILEVQVEVDGALLYLFDNHWKSGAGDPRMEKIRIANARTLRQRLDEILRADPNADVIIAGDFNSQYNQSTRYRKTMKETGLNDVLGSQGNELAVRGRNRDLYNLWFELPAKDRGSDTYQDQWGTLMQMMITRGLYDYSGVQYIDNSFGVAKIPGLNMSDDGTPLRWSFAGPGGSGFSDHFPIYAKFATVPDNAPDRYIPLNNPSDNSGLATVTAVDYRAVDLARVAVDPGRLPAGASLRDGSFNGRIVRVEGRVGGNRRLSVIVNQQDYIVWSYDAKFRQKLRRQYKAGDAIQFYGELTAYKGLWEFIVRDPSWMK